MENIEATLSAIKMALYGIMAAVLAVLLLVLYEHNGRNGFRKVQVGCGTQSTPISPKQQRGQDLFIANCASCHSKNRCV